MLKSSGVLAGNEKIDKKKSCCVGEGGEKT